MPWINRKHNWLGRQSMKPEPAPKAVRERLYTVQEAADALGVDKHTVMKWLMPAEDTGPAVIPAESWFKLPGSGHIRIREWIVLQLLSG